MIFRPVFFIKCAYCKESFSLDSKLKEGEDIPFLVEFDFSDASIKFTCPNISCNKFNHIELLNVQNSSKGYRLGGVRSA